MFHVMIPIQAYSSMFISLGNIMRGGYLRQQPDTFSVRHVLADLYRSGNDGMPCVANGAQKHQRREVI